MKYDLESGAHSKYALHYHLILVTKYRRDVFTEEIEAFLRTCIDGFADNYGVEILNLEAADDHIHLLFSATPTTDLAKFVNTLKGSTSRRIRNEYGDQLSDKLWGDSFWSQSYCLISTGQVSLDVLQQYVENQRIENE
ncbi:MULTISPECIES: IS200/IS605 family transposase [unclassified Haloferax]|uniref:IS200/IS605 family transposase n=1 Tax=unclassified Haloferax TaxID=2625095 RepID=UPI002876902F|nr:MULTISPECIES: IS200/IS605 family transposase [unclassified Haloferax]MDS0243739.1 IS200/IS605 family transposase [Haloferax sp. S2CR25]MDS0446860.1 IS200/IS605 family transposase [Haloferax sp. S2CR25-2]